MALEGIDPMNHLAALDDPASYNQLPFDAQFLNDGLDPGSSMTIQRPYVPLSGDGSPGLCLR